MNSSKPVVHPAVLLAEDDPDDIFFMKRAFERSGLSNRLFVVENGLEVLMYLKGKGPYSDRHRYPLPACSCWI